MKIIFQLVTAASFLLSLVSCTTSQPFPLAARAGDTIIVPVGSPDGMTLNNTTLSFVPDSDPANPIDLTPGLRALSKVYPDKTSHAWLLSTAAAIPDSSGRGPWLIVLTLDLPASMPVGPGVIKVVTTNQVSYPGYSADVNDIDIGFEVLSGVGESHGFDYIPYSWNPASTPGDLALLNPLPQLIIMPPAPPLPDNTQNRLYAGIEIKFNAPIRTSTGDVMQTSNITIVPDDMPNNIRGQVQMSWSRSNDDFTVNFISPLGTMKYYQARSSIVVLASSIDAQTAFPVQPTITSVRYFDIDGNVMSGPSPQLVVQ